MRVIRFYQSCFPPPRLVIFLLLLLLLFLLFLLFLASSSSSNFSSTISALFSTSTSGFPTLRQTLCQLSSPSSLPISQLNTRRWTSTWDLPSSMYTAGPQPGTFRTQCSSLDLNLGPAHCAPLDLNLGPSELNIHRWTSTWDLPSSMYTAGPQPGTFRTQCTSLDVNLGPAQWAPGPQPGTFRAQYASLDLNLGSSQLSVHRWSSTWDLPSSVCIAGPQPGICPAQCAPLDLNGQIECQKI